MSFAAPTLRAWWDRFWFEPEAALNLAAGRVVFALHALWLLLARDLAATSDLPAEFWTGVAPATRWRYLLFEGHAGLESGVQALAAFALVGAAAGVWPRACCLLAGLLLYHLAPLETLIWTPSPYERGFTISVLGLVTLSLSRCGDALRPGRSAPGAASWEYAWPLRLIQLFLCQIYLFSGWSKLARVGWSWASAENVQRWLLVFTQQDQIAVFRRPGLWLAAHPELCQLVGVLALAVNFGFVLVLFSRRLRRWLVPLAVAFHAGILVTMNIAFLNLPQLLVFLDWARLRRSTHSEA